MTELRMDEEMRGPSVRAVSRMRSDAAIASARRHSLRVRLLKIVLPMVAVALIAGFALRAWVALPDGVSVDLGSSGVEDGRLVMANPRLDGFTSDNRSYSMVADRAIQDVGNSDRIDLEGISARLPFEGDDHAEVEAARGTFDRIANTLAIEGGMTVTTGTGLVARLRSADIAVDRGSLTTADPVEIELEGSRISADSLAISERGAVIVFERRVRMQIDPTSIREAGNVTGDTLEN